MEENGNNNGLRNIIFGVLIGTAIYQFSVWLPNNKTSKLEQKTQNEILIDSTKVDTTKHCYISNQFNYVDYFDKKRNQ